MPMETELVREGYFNFRLLRSNLRALGFTTLNLPYYFKRYLGARVTKQAVSVWFKKGHMPVYRLAELAVIVHRVTGRRLSFWRYVSLTYTRFPPLSFAEGRAAIRDSRPA